MNSRIVRRFSLRTGLLVQYALKIEDPDLVQLVHRVEAGEVTIDHVPLE